MSRLAKFWGWLWDCRHSDMSWVFSDRNGLYTRCLICGQRFPYTAVPFAVSVPKKGDAA
jgi:hypothetical protein